jgi:uncharacterized protein (DUF2147 family)
MTKLLLTFCLLVGGPFILFGQIAGKWTSIDDNTGQERSVIEITEQAGKFFGKVIKIYSKPGEDPDPICDKCPDDDPRFNQKVIGMEILKELVKEGDEYINGHILDPENGKVYRCKLWLEGKVLKVRGYWGPFFRTQTWRQTTVRP